MSVASALKKMTGGKLPVKVGEQKCKECDNMVGIWEFKGKEYVRDVCNECEERELIKSLNLPDLKKEKKRRFVMQFEQVSGDLKGATVNSYVPKHETQAEAKKEIVQLIKNFEENKSQSLVLGGSPGLGKSHLAYAAAKAIRQHHDGISLFITTSSLLDHFKKAYDSNSIITEEKLYEILREVDLLVLDDIGSEYIKKSDGEHETWGSTILVKVLNNRQDKATIYTTNYSSDELTVKYGNDGPRILSRMCHGAKILKLEGEDHRLKDVSF